MVKLKEEFKKFLVSKKQEFNKIYYIQSLNYSSLESKNFSDTLEHLIDLLSSEISEELCNKVEFYKFCEICFTKVLEMVARNFLGENSTKPDFSKTWLNFLKTSGILVFLNPEFYFIYLPNSLINLQAEKNFLVENWLNELHKFIQKGYNLDLLLKLGFILAWKHGIAKYREKALEYLETLTPTEINLLFNINLKPEEKSIFFYKLKNNPYQPPHLYNITSREPQLVFHLAGGFLGFGEKFYFPPRFVNGCSNYITDGVKVYKIYSDYFGISLEPTESKEISQTLTKTPLQVQMYTNEIQISSKFYLLPKFPKEDRIIRTDEHSFYIVSPLTYYICAGGIYQ